MSGDRLRSGVPWLRRGRPAWAVPVLLFLAVLIVAALAFNLANLETGEESAPTAGGTAPGSVFPFDPMVVDILLVAFVGAFIATAIYMILTNRVRRKQLVKKRSWWDVLSSILAVVMVLVLLFAWPRLVHTLQPTNNTADTTTTTTESGNVTAWPASVGAPLGLFLAVSVLVTILALTYLLRRPGSAYEGDRDDEPGGPDVRRKATAAVQTAIQELELGGDVRQVILACFERFCRLLGARGITEQVALTPRELERLAIVRLRVSPDASDTLTSLFEEARYSEHALGEADRVRAIDSLAGIRAALEA